MGPNDYTFWSICLNIHCYLNVFEVNITQHALIKLFLILIVNFEVILNPILTFFHPSDSKTKHNLNIQPKMCCFKMKPNILYDLKAIF